MDQREQPIKNSFRAWLFGVLVIIIFGIVLVKVGSLGIGQSGTSSSDLKTKVSATNSGIEVTNLEAEDWQDCMVGVNGGTGWGFDNPPFQTHGQLIIPAGKTTTVDYRSLTASDGTRFEYSSHAVNTVVIDCFKGTTSARSWVGAFSNSM
jgi:hypothetical protein